MWNVFIPFCIFAICFTLRMKVNAEFNCPISVKQAIIDFHREKNLGLRSSINPMFAIATGDFDTYVCDHLRVKFGEETLSKCDGLCKRIQRIRTDGIDTIDNVRPITTACNQTAITCEPAYPYRTADGSCNNLQHPRWGQTGGTQPRWLPNSYADGKDMPRTTTSTAPGSKLPSARLVSNTVHNALPFPTFDSKRSMMVMQWGQFIAHDIILTPEIPDLDCADKDKLHKECFNIDVGYNDSIFNESLPFSRSDFMLDCSGTRQQVNFQTSCIDGSHIYGSTQYVRDLLRGNEINGKMKMINKKLPINPDDSTCILQRDFDPLDNYCTFAGDIRSDEQPGLTSIHTLFVREHNRIAIELYTKNPTWDSEKIFQEARKIVAALLQHITYNEWLPAVVGLDILKKHNIDVKTAVCPYKNTYNPYVDASTTNSFGAAVLRFGHSMIPTNIGRVPKDNNGPPIEDEPLQKHFFRPNFYHSFSGEGLEMVLRWFTNNKLHKVDRIVESSARNSLFEKDDGTQGSDVCALNIQRGREHGLPGYNKFRAMCGLQVASHMNYTAEGLVDMVPENAHSIQAVYDCADDIDLFTGMLSERPLPGLIVGPLLQCLIVKQFKALRVGDRFFYEERRRFTGFSKKQLKAIKKVSFASVICANTDSQTMQENVFYKSDDGGKSCSDFSKLDLNAWKDQRSHY